MDSFKKIPKELIDLLKHPECPTAFVVTDDFLGVSLEQACRDCGLSVPNDISIISFNNSLFAQLSTPPLTSIDINSVQLGMEAATQIIKHIENPNLTSTKIIVPVSCGVLFLYLTFCYRVARGVSIGGAFCNVRIISKDTTPLKLKTCIVRAALLSLLLLCVYNVFYMFLLRTQISFYDEATDTRGVERNPTLDVEDLQ